MLKAANPYIHEEFYLFTLFKFFHTVTVSWGVVIYMIIFL